MSQREWECILAGRLAEDWEVPGRSAVFINSQDSVQFSLKLMSDSPELIADVEHYTCWGNKLPDFDDDRIADDDERIEAMQSYLTGKIVLFKPIQRINYTTSERYHSAEPIAVLDAPESISEHARLLPILNITDMEPEEFEAKVLGRRPVAPYHRTFPKEMPTVEPTCVWVGEWLYGPFRAMRPVFGGWSLSGDDVRKVKVDLKEFETLVLPFRNTIFVEADTYFQNLHRRLVEQGVLIGKSAEESPTAKTGGDEATVTAAAAVVPGTSAGVDNEKSSETIESTVEQGSSGGIVEHQGKISSGENKSAGSAASAESAPSAPSGSSGSSIQASASGSSGTSIQAAPSGSSGTSIQAAASGSSPAESQAGGETGEVIPASPHADSSDELSEAAFLLRLQRLARAKRLFYDESDLVNFHTAVKTGSLVLLAGMSGTGKSKLVQIYAEALGLSEEQFKIVPIRPTWTDGSDLLGFLDLNYNLYRPADAGLVELIVKAERNPDKMFLVCFDEMNLARVEHYFSQFISVLELDAKHRHITLYSENEKPRVYNSDMFPPQVSLGTNIIFVGTINVDESTYAFSDKVLDRAQVIRPKVLPFSSLRVYLEQKVGEVALTPVPLATYDRWRERRGDIDLNTAELEFLEKMHNELHGVDKQLGIGYRTLRQIDAYLQNIPLDDDNRPMVERSVAFDWQVVQKVLTKLRGPSDHVERLVGHLNEEGEIQQSSLVQLMDEYQHISSFALSRQEIESKARELRTYGYAS